MNHQMNAYKQRPDHDELRAMIVLALRGSAKENAFSPESKSGLGSLMAASVFAVGVAALAVLVVVVVMAATNVGVSQEHRHEGGCNGGTRGTTRSTEIYLHPRDDLTVGQKEVR